LIVRITDIPATRDFQPDFRPMRHIDANTVHAAAHATARVQFCYSRSDKPSVDASTDAASQLNRVNETAFVPCPAALVSHVPLLP
jgi:hypothetical protein